MLTVHPNNQRLFSSLTKSSWSAVLSVVGLSFLGLAYVTDTGRTALVFASLCTIVFFVLLFRLAGQKFSHLFFPRVFMVAYVVQPLAIAAIAISGMPTVAPIGIPIDIAENPLLATLPSIILPSLMCALAGISRLLPSSQPKQSIFVLAEEKSRNEINFVLSIFAVLMLLLWFNNYLGDVLGYMVRVVVATGLFLPFFAGRLHTRNSKLFHTFWYSCLVINLLIGAVIGSRGPAFSPILFFLLGRLSFSKNKERRKLFFVFAISAIVGIVLAGLITVLRNEAGRIGAEKLNSAHVERYMDALHRNISEGSSDSDLEGLAYDGLSRLVFWTSVVIPIVSPDIVPFRGFDTFLREVKSSMTIAWLTGETVGDRLDQGLGTIPAVRYGFNVAEGTSVEFGVLAGAWSRSGILAAIALLGCVAFLLYFSELTLLALARRRPAMAILLFTTTLTLCISPLNIPFIAWVRDFVLKICFFTVLFAAILLLRKLLRIRNGRLTAP